MKRLYIVLTALLISNATFAFETSKPDKKLVAEYLVAAKFEDAANATLAAIVERLPKNTPPEQLAALKNALNKTIGWDATKDQLADLVTNTYTKQELEAYIQFSKTPAGITYSEKITPFSKGFSEIVIQNEANMKKGEQSSKSH